MEQIYKSRPNQTSPQLNCDNDRSVPQADLSWLERAKQQHQFRA